MPSVSTRRAGAALLVAAAAGGALTAGGASAATSLNVRSEKQGVSFTKSRLTAEPGRVTITLRVPRGSQFPHAIAIRGGGVDKAGEMVQRGRSRVRARLSAGTYTFYCPVGEHAANGMRGRLVVR